MGQNRANAILEDFGPLSDAERYLISAAKEGQALILGDHAPLKCSASVIIRAGVVKALVVDEGAGLMHHKGVRIRGAWIDGTLDLDHCRLERRLCIDDSRILSGIVLSHADLAEFSLNGSKVGYILALHAQFRARVYLRNGFSSADTVNFSSSKINGAICCDGAAFLAEYEDGGEVRDAINLQNASISGSMVMGVEPAGGGGVCEAFGTIRLTEAVIGGSVNFCGTKVKSRSDKAIMAQGVTIAHSLHLSRFSDSHFVGLHSNGTLDFNSSKIGGQVTCIGANVETKTPRLGSSSHLFSLGCAQLGGQLILLNSRFQNGSLCLNHSSVRGQVTAVGLRIYNPGGSSFEAHTARIGGSVLCNDGVFNGGMFFNHSTIEGNLELDGAEVGSNHPVGGEEPIALMCQGAHINGSAFFRDGFRAEGRLDLSAATVEGQVEFIDAALGNNGEGNVAFSGHSLEVGGTLYWKRTHAASGLIFLTNLHAGAISDELACWPTDGRLHLDGLSFTRFFDCDTAVERRLSWLHSSSEGSGRPQPYINLADVYGLYGDRASRIKTLVTMERSIRARNRAAMRKSRGVARCCVAAAKHVWDEWVLRRIVGFGYRPGLAAWYGLLLMVFTALFVNLAWKAGDFVPAAAPVLVSQDWMVFASDSSIRNPAALWSSRGEAGQDYETFRPWIYAFDVVVPLADLGQDDAWTVSTERSNFGWIWHHVEWVVRILGWTIAALVAASVSGFVRNE